MDAPAKIRPYPRVTRCPYCGGFPVETHRYLDDGMRMECKCGACGPITKDRREPYHAAREAWNALFARPPPDTG